jgi:signal transduction histidine kinase
VIQVRVVSLVLAFSLGGCIRNGEREWQRADEMWQRRDPGAFAAWRKLDQSTPWGALARDRLARADAAWRQGIALFALGDSRSREVLARAADLGPLDPALYLSLARTCHARGLDDRAAAMYRRFLAQAPPGADADAAHRELAALSDDSGGLFEPASIPAPLWSPWLITALAVAVTVAMAGLAWRQRTRRQGTLGQLAADNPELQPAISFLIGCLRHELFKHRIFAVGEAVRAAAEHSQSDAERRFLALRLFGGEPLRVAWAGHLGSFMRVLGPRFDLLRHDPAFRDADRAISTIAAAEVGLRRGDQEAARRVLNAHTRLGRFDAALGQLSTAVQHTVVNAAVLTDIVEEVRNELGGAPVDITMRPPDADIAVECYRFDLMLVLRNVLRNAVTAAAAGPSPARVGLDFDVAVEPTGEEIVRLYVRDTNPAPLPTSTVAQSRGLALVRAALQRCDGSLAIEPGVDGFAKCVVVRLFGALDAAEEAA